MGAQYKPVQGDRVRVVLEGEVQKTWGAVAFDMGNYEAGGGTNHIIPRQEHVVSVEKIEPPVEVFKVGSVVRRKSDGQLILILEGNRYADLNGEVAGWIGHGAPLGFRSDNYELVELA